MKTVIRLEGFPKQKGFVQEKQWHEKTEMSRHYWGNMVRAWREGLDRDHNDRMDYNEFSVAVKDVGYAGNAKELWQELDLNKNGYVSLWVPWIYMGVSLNGGTPKTPFLVGKPMVVGYHHFRKPPYTLQRCFPGIFSIGPVWSQKLQSLRNEFTTQNS